MKIEEIYNDFALKMIEDEIIKVNDELFIFREKEKQNLLLRLLLMRKRILNNMFSMNKTYRSLLEEFNEVFMQSIKKMYELGVSKCQSGAAAGMDYMTVMCTLYPYTEYPQMHPIQNRREKQIWELIQYTDKYLPDHTLNFYGFSISLRSGIKSFEELINRDYSNISEEIKKLISSDMNICTEVQLLLHLTPLSIFDILWVRQFHIVIEAKDFDGEFVNVERK